jgi:DNA-binding CsgD family transcriptional regulator
VTKPCELQSLLCSSKKKGGVIVTAFVDSPTAPLSLFSLIEWLNGEPQIDEICRGVVLAYLHQYQPSKSRIVCFRADDSLQIIGEYGYISAVGQQDRIITPEQWRQSTSDFSRLLGTQERFFWNRSNTTVVMPFLKHGIVHGALAIGFEMPQRKTEEIGLLASQLGQAISLYVNLSAAKFTTPLEIRGVEKSEYEIQKEKFLQNHSQNTKTIGAVLTHRQIDILEGLIEGKTNYDIAADLGYSVSTIRQETIKIYSALKVTGRRAAAQEALRQQIV